MSADWQLRPADEAAHERSGEALWNESWYFDFADSEQGSGGWLRLGLYPNEDRAWINVLLCGPGRPTIALNDFHAALPEDPTAVSTPELTLTQQVVEPLLAYRITVTGTGQVYDDPAGLLRGESGRPAQVSLDLLWTSVGEPFPYGLATRYEIPCTVSGTVTVDGQTHAIDAAPGQRDHSWGVRDWWSMDWVWSALHLDDGTHVHAVEIRIPGLDGIGIGYVQREGSPLVELQRVSTREAFEDNGLPVRTELELEPGGSAGAGPHARGTTPLAEPGGLALDTRMVAHAPVALVADDGRVAQFPRAWVSVTAADGRSGVGWVEWNRNG